MVGVNVAASRFMGNSAAASAEAEKRKRYQRPRQKVRAADRITARQRPG